MTSEVVVQVGGLIIAFATFGFTMWRAVMAVIDKNNDSQNERIDALHSRVNDVKDNYVRRDDFDKLERQVERVGDEVKQSSRETNARLDTILSMMAGRGHEKNS